MSLPSSLSNAIDVDREEVTSEGIRSGDRGRELKLLWTDLLVPYP